jgi:hypothetical protein
MKHRFPTIAFLAVAALVLAGCATLIKGSDQKVSFSSEPSGAKLSVFDTNGARIAGGKTPITLPLKRGAGFFQAAKYRVVFEAPGYAPKEVWLSGSIDAGWYVLGNFVCGYLVGWLIIDPISGAMWDLKPDSIHGELEQGLSMVDGGLRIVLAQDLPPDILAQATPIAQTTN